MPRSCDVVVIGGGPGGSLGATYLARKGYDVVLLDKEKHPRYRVGESLIPHMWKYLRLGGAEEKILNDGFIKKTGGTVIWNGVIRELVFGQFGFDRPAMHVERDRYDQILFEHAKAQGVRAFEEMTVLGVDLNGGERPSVRFRAAGDDAVGTIACRYVIDASGQNAVIAKQLGVREIDEGFRFMSLWGYFLDSKYVALGGKVHPFKDLNQTPPTTFVCSVDELGEWGWLWHIPLRESTSIGLVVPVEQLQVVKKSDEALEKYFLRKCYEVSYLGRLLEGATYLEGSFHVIRDYSYRTSLYAGPGFYLVGDAAAFVDPLFSVGVVFAMYSAFAASWAVDRSLRRPEIAESNRAIFSRQISGRLEVARALALPRYAKLERPATSLGCPSSSRARWRRS
ncbi:MAG: tryptophan 7-halogenase [Gemmatimonadetes bacterium]|nr:tryptophan 7-halogenase [Gemmatimonadota bacterium]